MDQDRRGPDEGIEVMAWRDGHRQPGPHSVSDISELVAGGHIVWIDIANRSTPALQRIAAALHLDPLLVEDAVAHHERSKAVVEPSYLFLNCYSVRYDAKAVALTSYEIAAFATDRVLVTVGFSDWEHADELMHRCTVSVDQCRIGAIGFLYLLLDTVVDSHSHAVDALDDQIDEIGDRIYDDRPLTRAQHLEIFAIRRALVRLRRAALPMREVLLTLTRRDSDLIPPRLMPFLQDVYDHVVRVAEEAESLRDTVTDLFETNLSLQDARMNTIMKKLTGWAAIVAVPTAITGYFGQNVPFPGFGHQSGFAFSLALIAVAAVVLYIAFKRRDWL